VTKVSNGAIGPIERDHSRECRIRCRENTVRSDRHAADEESELEFLILSVVPKLPIVPAEDEMRKLPGCSTVFRLTGIN
jgi:hypothetical protein